MMPSATPAIVVTIGALAVAGCLFPDYRIVEGEGGSGGVAGVGNSTSTGGTSTAGDSGMNTTGGSSPCAGDSGGDACTPSPTDEDCGNGVDDDTNGKTDCFDMACATDEACSGRCIDAMTVTCATVRTGESSGSVGSTSRIGPPAYGCSGTERSGPEYAYRVTGVPGQNVFVQAYGLDGDVGLFLIDVPAGSQCDATSACTSESDAAGTRTEVVSFLPQADHDYFVVVDGAAAAGYSLTVQCMPVGSCKPAIGIEAGQTISGSTTEGLPNVTNDLLTYSCRSINHYGPEAAYLFTPRETGTYEVRLTNLSTNLGLFILQGTACNGMCLDSTSFSDSAAAMDEIVTFTATADTPYYIVIDTFTSGSFDLTVTQL